ncbi:MAG: helix-turn-helix transcriptional regulator [Lachnospiraceae bacterium]|nr:helix-turn-helix transcriptional regulator [Lachnospiraceae bacterium]
MNDKIGKFIAETRNQAGMTQKELADKIGVSDKTVSKWECGKSMPDISYLEALCKSLSINMNELISGQRLTEADYSTKAEENIMTLMNENNKIRKSSVVKNIIGIALAIIALFLMLASTAYSWTDLIIFYLDFPTLFLLTLLNIAGVLLAGKKKLSEILDVLLKISIPNGILVATVSFITVLVQLSTPEHIGLHLSICALSIVYALLEWLVVYFIRQHIK